MPTSFVIGRAAGLCLALGLLAVAGPATAQNQAEQPRTTPVPSAACPPDVKGPPPTVGGPSSPDLSDRLADSKGVICPPAGVDPEIHATPPEAGGTMKVVPPPGSPGGAPNVEPK